MGETESSKMKVAPFVLALAGFTSAEKCAASRGPRPDFEADVTQAPPVTVTEGWRQLTEAYVDPNSQGKSQPIDDCVCGIEDYKDPSVASWRTNCPSGCELYQYLEEVEDKLNADWNRVEAKLNNQLRAGINGELHLTLDKILEKIKEALNTIKKEKNQFLEIKKIYRAGGIADIINDQRLKLAELTTKKSKLQIELSNKQKEFKEQAGFCKVSFMQYDEEVCDILDFAKNY